MQHDPDPNGIGWNTLGIRERLKPGSIIPPQVNTIRYKQ